jgi:hypothetical protein
VEQQELLVPLVLQEHQEQVVLQVPQEHLEVAESVDLQELVDLQVRQGYRVLQVVQERVEQLGHQEQVVVVELLGQQVLVVHQE